MADKNETSDDVIVIKKYANRRLYNTKKSSYVTLDHLAEMVREGQDFVVTDAKTSEDITRSVLTQIIFEEESKGHNMLPTKFLRQLISNAFCIIEIAIGDIICQRLKKSRGLYLRIQFVALVSIPAE